MCKQQQYTTSDMASQASRGSFYASTLSYLPLPPGGVKGDNTLKRLVDKASGSRLIPDGWGAENVRRYPSSIMGSPLLT